MNLSLSIPSLVEKPNQIFCKAMVTEAARLSTFANSPTTAKQRPIDLVMCGFYSRGPPDKLVCYHCGLGLRDWLPDDDPWMEHALNSRHCPYLLSYKNEISFNLKPQDHGDIIQKLLVIKTFILILILVAFLLYLL